MLRLGLVLITLVLIHLDLSSQIVNIPGSLNRPLRESRMYRETLGSPYLIDEYLNGTIRDKEGKVYEVYIKYDTFKDEVEVFNEGHPLLIDKDLYPYFTMEFINDKTLEKVNYSFSNKIKFPEFGDNKYAKILHESDDISLYKVFKTILNQNSDAGYGGKVPPNSFVQREYYFIKVKDKEPVEVKTSNKGVLKNMDQSDELKDLLKKNKLKIREEEDLLEFVRLVEQADILN